jgi:hypothetical protein
MIQGQKSDPLFSTDGLDSRRQTLLPKRMAVGWQNPFRAPTGAAGQSPKRQVTGLLYDGFSN